MEGNKINQKPNIFFGVICVALTLILILLTASMAAALFSSSVVSPGRLKTGITTIIFFLVIIAILSLISWRAFFPPKVDRDHLKYAGVGSRFFAGVVDFICFLPIVVFFIWANSYSRTVALILAIPYGMSFLIYNVYFHAKFGQTLGKKVAGIKVLRNDESDIGFEEALKRSSVDSIYTLLNIIGTIWALYLVSEASYASLSWIKQTHLIGQARPAIFRWSNALWQVWIWSECVVVLLNSKKRAIHDFIAGTIVVHTSRVNT